LISEECEDAVPGVGFGNNREVEAEMAQNVLRCKLCGNTWAVSGVTKETRHHAGRKERECAKCGGAGWWLEDARECSECGGSFISEDMDQRKCEKCRDDLKWLRG
jgi:ribosomal protein S27AE